jgi:hypothetical protein
MIRDVEIREWRVREAADRCGIRELKNIAEALGITRGTLSNWFTPGYKIRRIEALDIAAKFRTTIGEIERVSDDGD